MSTRRDSPTHRTASGVRVSDLPCPAVDAHHHLWDLRAVNYPWLMARGVRRFFGDPSPIQKDYGIDEFRADIGQLPVKSSVHVQVGADDGQAEAAWVERQCNEGRGTPRAQVAFCALEKTDVPRQLDALSRHSSLRGVRQIIGRAAEEDRQSGAPNLLGDANWRAGLAVLAERQLSFDLQLVPEQLAEAADIVASVPGLRVALCHCGSPWEQSGQGFRRWQQGIETLARNPLVYCKISGLGMFNPNWTVDALKPIAYKVIDAFGPQRCMLGSNFPVDSLYRDYRSYWRAYAEMAQALNATDSERLFAGTATEFYRLETA